MKGSLVLSQDGVEVRVEWGGGALTVPQFTEALEALTRAWVAVQGPGASPRFLLASSMTYTTGEESDD